MLVSSSLLDLALVEIVTYTIRIRLQFIQFSVSKQCTSFTVIKMVLSISPGTVMYVVIGMVSKNVAGPAVALSFCFAAVSALLSGDP